MRRRTTHHEARATVWILLILPVGLVLLFIWCAFLPRGSGGGGLKERVGVPMGEKVEKTDAEWRAQLTEQQFQVARKHGTERAFTGEYWNAKDDGVYLCVCCGQPLFDSTTKFDSGTGWPSFFKPAAEDNVSIKNDQSAFMSRMEVLCSRCDAHLGHVFEDGPKPTGLRYCMNSAALKLAKRDDAAK